MNFDNLRFVKMGKNINIFNKDMEKIFFIKELSTPFGNESNNSVNYINWSLDKELLELLMEIDRGLNLYMKQTFEISDEWKWCSAIRPLDNSNILRTTNTSGLEVNKRETYIVKITLNCIWLNKTSKSFGILWLC